MRGTGIIQKRSHILGKKILLIDDESELLQTLETLFASRNYEILSAKNGTKGIERAKEYKPDLIILDIMMPGMDGFEVLERLKDDDKTAQTPVIMLTAKSETDSIFKAEKLEALDYVIKPYKGEQLLKLVKKYLG